MTIKDGILVKAGELFLSYGIRSVTMDEIAGNLGMSKKTLYQYFSNKSELIQEIMLAKVEQDKIAFAQIYANSANAVQEILEIAEHVIYTLRKITPALMYDLHKYHHESWCTMQDIRKEQIYAQIKSNLERGLTEGVYRKEIDPDVIAKIYVATVMIISGDEVFPIQTYPKYKVVEMFMNYHIHGIASPKGLALLQLYKEEIGKRRE
jgi:AcrR family transcriptional regulator